MNKSFLTGLALVAAANIFWGTMGSAAQYLFSSGSITPLALTMMRLVAAGILLVLCASLVIPRQMWGFFRNWRDMRDIAVNGVLLFGAHSTFFEAVYYSNAGTGAILLTFAPLVTVLYFALAKHRPVAKREALCIALASAGVVLIVTNGSLTSLRFSPLAVLWGFVSACFYAAYTIQPAAVIRRVGTTPVAGWGILFGGIAAMILCPPWTVQMSWGIGSLAAFSYIVVAGTVLAFWLFLTGLKKTSPVAANLLSCLEPLSGFFCSILLLGDTLGAGQAAGIVCVLSTVWILALSKRQPKAS